MGRRTHGPYLVAAIEYNDIEKINEILVKQFRDRKYIREFLISEVPRLLPDQTEIPLLLAATLPDPTILRYFVTKHDVDINHVFEFGLAKRRHKTTALLTAVRRGQHNMVDVILSLNGDANFADHRGRRPLHHAIRQTDYRMAKMLLSRGANANAADNNGNTPLHTATIYGHTELVKLLLQHGGDVYKKGQHGAIAIHMAAYEGHATLVRLFCQLSEVNPNLKVPCYGEKEKAPLHVAAERGHSETVFTLLEHCGAGVDIRDSEGESPLHCAVISEYDPFGMKSKDDYVETVKLLLNYGADANARNARGESPLHLAARNEFQKVVEVLVLAGCDPTAQDNDNNKPIDLVSDEDTVSQQTLRHAATERERYMNESMEVRARGFSTVTQQQAALPLSVRSPSLMSMPLLIGAAPSVQSLVHAANAPGLFASPRHSVAIPSSCRSLNDSCSGFMSPIPMLGQNGQMFAGPFQQQIYGSNCGLSQPMSPQASAAQPLLFQQQVPSQMGSRSATPICTSPSRVAVVPAFENGIGPVTVTQNDISPHGVLPGSRRTGNYQPSENSSLWNVTDTTSLSTLCVSEPPQDAKQRQRRLRKVKGVQRAVPEISDLLVSPASSRRSVPTAKKTPIKFGKDAEIQNEDDEDTFTSSSSSSSFDTVSINSEFAKTSYIPENVIVGSRKEGKHLQSWLERQAEMTNKGLSVLSVNSEFSDIKSYASDPSDFGFSSISAPPLPPRVCSPLPNDAALKTKKPPPPVPLPLQKSPAKPGKKKALELPPVPDNSIAVEVDDTQFSGQTIMRISPPNRSCSPLRWIMPNAVAEKVLARLSDESFLDSVMHNKFSFSESLSSLFQDYSSVRALDYNSNLVPSKNAKCVKLQRKSSNEMDPASKTSTEHWEKIEQQHNAEDLPDGEGGGSYSGSNCGETKVKPVPAKRLKKAVQSTKAAVEKPANRTVALKAEAADDNQDDETSGSSDWSVRDIVVNSQSHEAKVRPFIETFRNSPTAQKLHAKSPQMFAPGALKFEKVTLDEPIKGIDDYLFSRSISELTTSSEENIIERIGRKMSERGSKTPDPIPVKVSGTTAPAGRLGRVPSPSPKYTTEPMLVKNQIQNTSSYASREKVENLQQRQQELQQQQCQQQQYQQQQYQQQQQLELERRMQIAQEQQHQILMQEQQAAQEQRQRRNSHEQVKTNEQQSREEHEERHHKSTHSRQASQDQQHLIRQHPMRQSSKEHKRRSVAEDSRKARESSSSSARDSGEQQLYEELPDYRVENRLSFGPDDFVSFSGKDMHKIRCKFDGKPRFTVCGGNVSGTFVFSVDSSSPAVKAGLRVGDQILSVDKKLTKNMSKEEVFQLFQQPSDEPLSIVVGRDDDRFRLASSKNAVGDSFHVRARFNYVPIAKKGELAIKEDDIFQIIDSMPEDAGGFWRAKRVSTTLNEPEGLIPNKLKAEQIIMKQKLLAQPGDASPLNKRRGILMRSFRRSKSIDRSANVDPNASESATTSEAGDILTYEKVEQRQERLRRPVVLYGLFCDEVCKLIAKDSPGLYEVPREEIERRSSGDDELSTSSVNVSAIRSVVNHGRHCLMIVSPATSQFLREKTDLKPIIIYLSASKQAVKELRDYLAPNCKTKSSFLYEEAARFEKYHAAMFDAIIPFKTDGSWQSLLKDTIGRFQRQPQWKSVDEDDILRTGDELCPDLIQTTTVHGGAKVAKAGQESKHHSRTTDDIPDQLQDLLARQLNAADVPLAELSHDAAPVPSNIRVQPRKSILKHTQHNRSLGSIEVDPRSLVPPPVAAKPPKSALNMQRRAQKAS